MLKVRRRQTGFRAVYSESREGNRDDEHAGTLVEGRRRTGPDGVCVAVGAGGVSGDWLSRHARDGDQWCVRERREKPHVICGAKLQRTKARSARSRWGAMEFPAAYPAAATQI